MHFYFLSAMILYKFRMVWLRKIVAVCLLRQVACWSQGKDEATPARIAIIGGGVGGTAAAYFLHQHLGDGALIDVYEAGEVGGRLATLPIGGHTYEIGGSIIHPQNNYMVDFAKKFGLPHRETCGGRMGLFNGEEYVFRDSDWEVVNIGRLLWRYGVDAYNIHNENQEMLDKFGRIYKLQAEGQAYRNLSSLLHAMDPRFLEMTHLSTRNYFKEAGMKDLIIDELVTAVTKCNYGQTADLHAFVGAIAVAAADPELWAVRGGNRLVPEQLLEHSRASLLKRKVTGLARADEGGYLVSSMDVESSSNDLYNEGDPSKSPAGEPEDDGRTQAYDMVIIAAPLTHDKTNIKFSNFTKEFKFPGRYERIVCTMVQGKLHKPSVKLPEEDPIDEILVTKANLMFNSIGKQMPVDVRCSEVYPDVWKIFSPRPLGEDQLDILFESRDETHVIDWLAYPHYDSDQMLADFELAPGLYHLNAVEWAGSAMEMSCIAAKNVALLALKHWLQNPDAGGIPVVKDEL